MLARHIALVQRIDHHHRHRQRRQPLRYRRGRRAGHQGLHRGTAQALVDGLEARGKPALRVVHADHRRRQHALFQRIRGDLRLLLHLRVQALGAAADQTHGEQQRQQDGQGQQREAPVQPHQIAEQRQQRETVAHQGEQAGEDHAQRQLRLVHRRADQAAGAFALQLRELGMHNLAVHQRAHPRQHVLRHPLCEKLRGQPRQSAHREQPKQDRRDRPQGEIAVRCEANVEHMLHQRRKRRLGRRDDGGEEDDEQCGGAVAGVGRE
ncbi:hypothetical protein GALL_326260 [mine drainage metagenome]|uniref:Uncharacterized protein n=1 Tax=mine drainage metagenome TaxID=410659 RepID=A0A1J5R723_9ZZZZ